MKIADLLSPDAISVDMRSTAKDDILAELADILVESDSIKRSERSEILKKLKEREVLGSTGIGKGVAIPHAKCQKTKKMISAFGISKKGVDFKSLDGEPTHIFFLLVAPGETPGPHLKALAKISRLLDDKFIRDRLRGASSAQEVYKVIKDEEAKNL